MPLQLLKFNPGVNRESTQYAAEGRWYDCDKVRFRKNFPEKIGGWRRVITDALLGVCRSIKNWVTLGGANYISMGTHLKFYTSTGNALYDVTPIRVTTSAGDVTFSATNGSSVITVTDSGHGAIENDFVTFSGATSLGGNVTAAILNAEHQIISVTDTNVYTITVSVTANSSDSGNGGSSVVGAYQINTGPEFAVPLLGWGGGTWAAGTWANGGTTTDRLRVWSQANFGEDLVFGPRGGGMFFWDATNPSTRAVNVTSLSGASGVPTKQNFIFVSDVNRFAFCMGTIPYLGTELDPLLLRWSDQESLVEWAPAVTNQAGSLRLSRGNQIVTALQARQEILVWSDSTLYSLQFVGGDIVWGSQIVGDNISIASQNATTYANGISYWMGLDKFYMYNGTTQPLPCDVRRYVFDDFNQEQYQQVFAGTNEAFHEIWWYYPSAGSTTVNKYVVFNYQLNIWYYGNLARTAWLDSGLRNYPLAATYNGAIVEHEAVVDDEETTTAAPIESYIESADFDIEDGDRVAFVWRIMPDLTFEGSSADNPKVSMELIPKANSGSGITDPSSVGGQSTRSVVRSAVVPVEKYTDQANIRVRGRQMSVKLESSELGVKWQLGTPRMDIRRDGRR